MIRRDSENILTTDEVLQFQSGEEYKRIIEIFKNLPSEPENGINVSELRTFIFT